MTRRRTKAVILAAGKSTRMKSAIPKTLHPLAGKPMLGHVIDATLGLESAGVVLVVGPEMDRVADYARSVMPQIEVAIQEVPLGTGDAVKAAADHLSADEETVIIVFGDTPLIRPETLLAMREACENGSDIVVLGFEAADPTGYGRLVRGTGGELTSIVEHKSATDEQKKISLCNGGAMAVRSPLLLGQIEHLSQSNGEFYLTDIVSLARSAGAKASILQCPEEELMGVDSRLGLSIAEAIMQRRLRRKALDAGVTLADPETIYLCHDTSFGRDVTIGQNVVFGPGVTVGDNATIKPFSHLEGASVEAGAEVGPFARLRPGARIGRKARIGNFVEVKKAHVEDGAKVNHLAYIGDARVGANANVGAGTITCNYDGFNKYFTDIGAGAFIGSNSALVAPVKIGDGAYIASGSVITTDVPGDALGVGRARQRDIDGWAARFRTKHQKGK